MDERLQRTAASLREAGADWAVLTGPDTVCYATGHVVPIEAGPSPFAGGPTLALIAADGSAGLVAPNVETMAARAAHVGTVELYEGYAWDHPASMLDNFRAGVAGLVKRLGVAGRLAVEPETFVASLLDVLPEHGTRANITPSLRQARATKTSTELALLRRSAEAAAIGQRSFLRAVAAGRSELAVFADIRLAMEQFAGERVPVTGDFLSGRARTAGFTGWPIDRVIEAGDPVLCDLAPRVAGYWGDSCAALMVGPPTPAYERLFAAAKGALSLAVGIIRPGLPVAELDRQVREHVARSGFAYPHHTGHGIGTSVHEHPRLVPYETDNLRPDMVLMVEPGAYDPEIGGVRTEWMIRVTATGCEVLTDFEHTACPVTWVTA